jgi:hypothetical protein
MRETIKPPAVRPCGSCPYRKDVPSGVWDASEYAKLPEYDKPTGEQPPQVFLCHQKDGSLCAGWVAVHDMQNSLGLRFAFSMGLIAAEHADAIFDYQTDVDLFFSGAQAAHHGLQRIENPDLKAKKTIDKLKGRRKLQSIAKRRANDGRARS